jgi:hypothetical protein
MSDLSFSKKPLFHGISIFQCQQSECDIVFIMQNINF